MSSSYRQILGSTAIFSSVSGLEILLRVIRVKMIAIWLGPGGIGLMGIYHSLVTAASGIAGMGVGTSAVRVIAQARSENESETVSAALGSLRLITGVLVVVGCSVIFVAREGISNLLFDTVDHSGAIAWLAVPVGLIVMSTSLTAVLQGYRKVAHQAGVKALSSVFTTVLAIGLIWKLGEAGILWLVVFAPVFGLAVAAWFTLRLGAPKAGAAKVGRHGSEMLRQGSLVMLAASAMNLVVLLVIAKINRDHGVEAAGIFQAAWTVSFLYMGFVLDAMMIDYFPRLSEEAGKGGNISRLINEQMHVALVLGAPLLIGMIAFAPLIVRLFYTAEFAPAALLIQWMAFGNLVKLAGWPIGTVVVAVGRNGLFVFTQVEWVVLFLIASVWGLSHFGLPGIGMAFAAVYAIHLWVVYAVGRYLCGFRFSRRNLAWLLSLAVICAILFQVSRTSETYGFLAGALMLAATGLLGLKELRSMTAGSGEARGPGH